MSQRNWNKEYYKNRCGKQIETVISADIQNPQQIEVDKVESWECGAEGKMGEQFTVREEENAERRASKEEIDKVQRNAKQWE